MASELEEDKNYKGSLITYCRHNKLTIKFEPTEQTGPSHTPSFKACVYVNSELVGEGNSGKKKSAENIASKMALMTLKNREHQTLPVNPQVPQASQPVAAAGEEDPLGSGSGTAFKIVQPRNYVGIMNELCSKHKLVGTFIEVNRSGKHHDLTFYLSAKIGTTSYPSASGKNIKLARQKAAFLALLELKNTYPGEILLQKISPGSYVEQSGSGNSSFSGSTSDRSSERRSVENGASSLSSSGKSFQSFSSVMSSSTIKSNSPLEGYDSISKIASGSFGQVFKARYILDEICYAVKQVKLKNKKSVSEVTTLARLLHPNIVRYYHSWTADTCYLDCSSTDSSCSVADSAQTWLFIRMELCEHGTLKTWIRKRENVERKKSLDIFRQLVDGVAFIHANKLIHRDIKPANILFATETEIKITDFGLVTEITGENENQALQRTQCTGTPSYMAPEQENDKYENEVDIFPLGLILFELLCPHWTYHEKQREWINIRKGQMPETFITQNPYEETIIREMLSEDPKKRPTASRLKELITETKVMDSRTY